MNELKRDWGISYTRVMAVFMILICHLGTYYASGFVAELFVIGVEIFFCISGYLSNHKENYSYGKWIIKRIWRLFLPIFVFSLLIVIIIKMFCNNVSLDGMINCSFGIYGFNKLYPNFNMTGFDGFTHLWFITVIMICYIIVPFIDKLEEKFGWIGAIVVLLVVQSIFSIFDIRINYITVFFIGYFMKRYVAEISSIKWVIVYNAILIFAFLLRIFSHLYFDDTWFYLQFIIPVTNGIEAIIILMDVRSFINKFANKMPGFLKSIIKHLESIAYEVYLVHYIFIEGFLNVFIFKNFEIINVIIFLVVSFLTAEVLHFICNIIIGLTSKNNK